MPREEQNRQPQTTIGLASVHDETYRQRVQRIFADIAEKRPLDPKYNEEQNRTLMIVDAQEAAEKEMLDEIHLMLRFLVRRAVS